MKKYFDLAGYKELKKLEKDNQIPFSDKNDQKWSDYIINILDQINYNSKIDYNSLLNKYVKKEILPYEFRSKFFEIDKMNRISTLCLESDILWSDWNSDRMSEAEFYFLVKRYSSKLLQEQLIFRSFKLLILALGLDLLLLSSICELKT